MHRTLFIWTAAAFLFDAQVDMRHGRSDAISAQQVCVFQGGRRGTRRAFGTLSKFRSRFQDAAASRSWDRSWLPWHVVWLGSHQPTSAILTVARSPQIQRLFRAPNLWTVAVLRERPLRSRERRMSFPQPPAAICSVHSWQTSWDLGNMCHAEHMA